MDSGSYVGPWKGCYENMSMASNFQDLKKPLTDSKALVPQKNPNVQALAAAINFSNLGCS